MLICAGVQERDVGEIDEIAIACVENRRRRGHAIVEQFLIDAGVDAEALFRRQGRIAILAEALIERRRLVAGADAGAQFGSRSRRCDRPRSRARSSKVWPPSIESIRPPSVRSRRSQSVSRCSAKIELVICRASIGVNEPSSGLGLCDVLAVSVSLRAPKVSAAEGAELQIALIFRAVARAVIAGAAIERVEVDVVAALGLPDVAVGVIAEDRELAAQQAAERIGGRAHEAVGDRRRRDIVMAEHVRSRSSRRDCRSEARCRTARSRRRR